MTPKGESSSPAPTAGAAEQTRMALPAWLDHFNLRDLKVLFRCWAAAWVATLLIFIGPALQSIGIATFFGALVLYIVPPAGILFVYLLASLTLLAGMCLGWAWGLLTMKAALAARPSSQTQARLQQLQQEVVTQASQSGQSATTVTQQLIHDGFMLDARVTVVFYAMACVFVYVMSRLRVSNNKFALAQIFSIIITDLFLLFGPTLPSFTALLPKVLIEPGAIGIGLGAACCVLFFPQSTSYALLTKMEQLLRLGQVPVKCTQARLLGEDLSLQQLVDTKSKGIGALKGLEPLLAFLPLDISRGHWGADDLKVLQQALRKTLVASLSLLNYHIITTTTEALIDSHAEIFDDEGNFKIVGMGGMHVLRGIIIGMVIEERILTLAEATRKLIEQILWLLENRPKPRLWIPSRLQYAFAWVGTGSVPTPMSAAAGNTATDPEALEERTREADRRLRISRGYGIPQRTRITRIVISIYQWLFNPAGMYALRMVVVTIATSIPSSLPHTAGFFYREKGIWGVITAQTTLLVYMADFHVCQTLSNSVRTISDHYALVLSHWARADPEHPIATVAEKITLEMAETLLSLKAPIGLLRFEMSFGPFNRKTLSRTQSLLEDMNQALGRLLVLSTTLPLNLQERLMERVGFMNDYTVGDIMAVLGVIEQALKAGAALPERLPTPLVKRCYEAWAQQHQTAELSKTLVRDENYRRYCVAISSYLKFLASIDELVLVLKAALGESHIVDRGEELV
ncbi:hypothetical protein ASPNIDRAFT_43533 [Aspergillus niger ATCC 1015]|uniref:Uncharacterized protein n=1 Tax=Aspergillus niger (strain ATCC 1015 / CBS 113.46 / FGSC A1144 / LSHB Ac4 / NCTC 3858a / NRRL 328 / USDA 3528.7) TaxID=380704 RepID=G3XM40_ASPNA|nr:hypothetical protein ASPNIDRAFT_43533 [Aspergillus niger ATCC 1015]